MNADKKQISWQTKHEKLLAIWCLPQADGFAAEKICVHLRSSAVKLF
jgi:hypothetical protein